MSRSQNNVSCCDVIQVKLQLRLKLIVMTNDITEHSHDAKRRSYVCTVCDKRF